MTFRDMTWCTHWEGCLSGRECFRALTPDVQEQAKMWWGSDDAPVSVFVDRPWCYEPKLGDEDE